MKAALILNPTAGFNKPIKAENRVEKILYRYGISCETMLTRKPGDASIMARNASNGGFDVIIAGGGDGTVNEVVNGLVGSKTPLGILPTGTVNVLARELGIPINLHKAAGIIAEGKVGNIDLGCANGRFFTLMAGFGFDAEVVANVLQPMKDMIGSSAYAIKALEMLTKYQATNVSIELPSETYSTEAFLIIVANVSTYTYNLKMAPYASPDDGLLDICVFERDGMDRFGFAGQIADLFAQKHMQHPAVRYYRASNITIRSKPEINVQLDGDTFGTTPVEISVAHKMLPVMMPGDQPQRAWTDHLPFSWFDN